MKSTYPIDQACEAAALFALGDLPEAEANRFEQRLESGCPLCLAELELGQRMVESLLLATDPVEPDPTLEARLFARIGLGSALPATSPALPQIVRSGEGSWKQIAPGVSLRLLYQDRTMLVRMEPGSRFPSHPHGFDEQCLVLEGAIEDTDGNKATAGDFIVMAKGSTHPPIFTQDGALFLVAYT
jgi:hypothetical protein